MEVSNAHFTLTRPEYMRASRRIILHQRAFWMAVLVFAIPVVSGLILLRSGEDWRNVGTFVLVYAVVFPVVLVSLILGSLARRWNVAPGIQSERVYCMTEEGLEMKSAVASGSYDWSLYARAIETKDIYLLVVKGSRRFVIIPKRGFNTREDEKAFREIVSRRIARPA